MRNTTVSTIAVETAYLHQFWAYLVLVAVGRFLGPAKMSFCSPTNTPLVVLFLGGVGLELAERAELEPAELDFQTKPSEPELADIGTQLNSSEPRAAYIIALQAKMPPARDTEMDSQRQLWTAFISVVNWSRKSSSCQGSESPEVMKR